MCSEIEDFDDFLVINVDVAYNPLLGLSRRHKNAVIPSTYHQFVKYTLHEGQCKLAADNNLFLDSEAYHAEACFYKLRNKDMAEDEYILTIRASKPLLADFTDPLT